MNTILTSPSKGRFFLLTLLAGFSVYWFGNAVLWIPWIVNKWLGMAVMLILVPFIWGYASLYCLKYVPNALWKRQSLLIAAVFLVVSVISDYFLFAVWRGIPGELYHPTTFAAYGLIVVVPFLTGLFFQRRNLTTIRQISTGTLLTIGLLGLLFLAVTLYSVRFW